MKTIDIEKHRKTIKIGGLKENNASWKQRRHQMHLDNQKFMAEDYKRKQQQGEA